MKRIIGSVKGRVEPSDAGVTVVELGVAMLMASLLSIVMIAWIFSGFNSDTTHRSYDDAQRDLRNVADQLTREIRAAGYLTTADGDTVAFWLDVDRDGVVDTGETIAWSIESDGSVTRTPDGAAPQVVATTLSYDASGFSYDVVAAADVTRVSLDLVAIADTTAGGDEVHHSVDIYMRNKR
jgi:Tfp pilus assembly protein PilW